MIFAEHGSQKNPVQALEGLKGPEFRWKVACANASLNEAVDDMACDKSSKDCVCKLCVGIHDAGS